MQAYVDCTMIVREPGCGFERRNTSTLAAALAMRSSSNCLYGQVA